MQMRIQLRLPRLGIGQDTEVSACLQPQIVWLAGMIIRRIEILFRVGRGSEQRSIDVRRQQVTFQIWGAKGSAGIFGDIGGWVVESAARLAGGV